MKTKLCLLTVCISLISFCQSQTLRFEQNIGQWDSVVLFMAKANGTNIFLTQQGITFLSHSTTPHNHNEKIKQEKHLNDKFAEYHTFKLNLVNAKISSITPLNEQIGYSNYFIGNDTAKWRGGVKAYSDIVYTNAYQGIDWRIYSNDGNFKHDFIVHSGAKPEDIVIQYSGLNNLKVKSGNLVMQTSLGEIVEHKPVVYQQENGKRIKIEAEFILNNNKVCYDVKNYNRSLDLIIDPELVFSTYSGSTDDNWGFTATYDKKGYFYAGGISTGIRGYPTTDSAYQYTNKGNWDVTITKFSTDGSTLIYSTYLGGSEMDFPSSLYVNEYGELLVMGITSSLDFPTQNAYQSTFGGGNKITYDKQTFKYGTDIFISKFASDGKQLQASTYVGGKGNDGLNFRAGTSNNGSFNSLYANYGDGVRGEIITDDRNNVYIGSCTFSDDFPVTANAFQPTYNGGQEGVVFKLDYSLSNMLFSSYLGGSDDDAVYSIDVDSTYRLYVTGGTKSVDFPFSPRAYQQTFGGGNVDGFLSLISYDGSQLLASTYYGSNAYDQSYFVRTDHNNCPHIFGQTQASDSQMMYGDVVCDTGRGQFLAKFTPMLDSLMWSGVFGREKGVVNISPSAFGIDNCGRVYVSGCGRVWKDELHPPVFGTMGMDITNDAYQSQTDGQDFYIASFNTDPLTLNYATFFGEVDTISVRYGTDHVDGGTSRFDKFGTLYQSVCASCEGTNGFPVYSRTLVWSDSNKSSKCNLAAVKFNVHNDFAVAAFDVPPIQCAPATIHFSHNSRGDGVRWFFGDGSSSWDDEPEHTYNERGVYNVTLVSYMSNTCWSSDTIMQQVIVLGNGRDTLPTLTACNNVPIQIGLKTNTINNVSYRWYPQTGLSNPNIPDPYVTIYDTTFYTLVITANGCSDTLVQAINLKRLDLNFPDTLQICNYPTRLDLSANMNYMSIIASWNRDFTDTIFITNPESSNPYFYFATFENKYLYFKQLEDVCKLIDSVFIDFNGAAIEVQTIPTSCNYTNDGKMLATITGIYSPYTYSVFNPETGNSSPILITSDTTLNISGYAAGNYILSVSNAFDCTSELSFTIISPYTLVVSVSNTKSNCEQGCSAMAIAYASGGLEPYYYLWSNGDTTVEAHELCVGDHTLILTDSLGCQTTSNFNVGYNEMFASLSLSASDSNVFDGATVVLVASPYIEDFSYQWSPTANLYSPNYHVTFATLYETTTFYLYASDGFGCDYFDSITIKVDIIVCGKPNIHVPNVFTPNGDGKNDILIVSGEFIRKFHFMIFDRWGEKVFETTNQNEGWDGRFRNQDCQNGVYYYRLEVECEADRTYSTSGDITLIR